MLDKAKILIIEGKAIEGFKEVIDQAPLSQDELFEICFAYRGLYIDLKQERQSHEALKTS